MYEIGIDSRMIHHTGIGTYIRELIQSMLKEEMLASRKVCLFGKRLSADKGTLECRSFRSAIYTPFEQIEYPFHVRQCRLWHSPHYNVPIVKGRSRLIVTIHDLIHWIYRDDFFNPLKAFYAKHMIRKAIQLADAIITVSMQTKHDLIEYFDADPDKISVIYEGVSDAFVRSSEKDVQDVRSKFGIKDDYFLYVGSIKPHKNVLHLIRLYRELRKTKKIHSSLVLVGKKDAKYPDEYKDLKTLKTGDGIIHIPTVTQKELVALYSGALCLVHPSLYEGFGLTLLEAMSCGTPVIASRAASLPEVAGDAACLVDPFSHAEMMEAMIRMEHAPNLRQDHQRKGLLHAGKFKWSEAARQTVEVYEKVLLNS